MKKRMISLILVLALSLTACGQQAEETSAPQEPSVPEEPITQQEDVLEPERQIPQTIDELPRLTGFVLTDDYGSTEILTATPRRLRELVAWGFNSARIMVTYETLFNDGGKAIRREEMEKLDKLVKTAEENGLHLNLLLQTLPGRTYSWDWESQSSVGELDLFVNPERMEQAKHIWQTLAERYKDVPGAYLSFTPFWEGTNYSLSTELKAPEYTVDDVVKGLKTLVDAIRETDPERFIIYELTANNETADILREDGPAYDLMKNYNNVRISFNFCEQPYVYALMADGDDETVHIDNQIHSTFLTEYPQTIYAARNHFGDGDPITLDGCLPAGTQIDIYVTHAEGGTVTASDQSGRIYRETLPRGDYERSPHLSMMYQYATSDKKISFTLERDAEYVTLLCTDWVDICGMDVYLPEEYAKEKWYMYSPYDAALDGRQSEAGLNLVNTSRIMICPNDFEAGKRITIHENLTYSSDKVWAASTKETMEAWGAVIHDFVPRAVVRFESANFGFNTASEDALAYYEDMLSMFDEYGMDWWCNDYALMTGIYGEDFHYHGAELSELTVEYHGYETKYKSFDLPLLQVLQKHQ